MNSRNRTSLLLIEIILSVFFFAAAGAICLEVFASAHALSVKSLAVTEATGTAGSIAEAFTAANGDPALTEELLLKIYPSAELIDSGTIRIDLDSDFSSAAESDAAYTATCSINDDGNSMAVAHITVERSNSQSDPLLTLTVEQYTGRRDIE